MWTKTTLRLSETNTPSQSSLSIFLTRIVYFGEESSFNREPRIPGPAGRQICSLYGIRGYKKRVVDGEPQVTRPTLNILWRGSSCRLACCGGKGQYSVSAADPAWSARLARTGLGSRRDADEDQKEQCRDPRTDAGEIENAELTAARGVGCGQRREGILEIRGRDHPWRSARFCRG